MADQCLRVEEQFESCNSSVLLQNFQLDLAAFINVYQPPLLQSNKVCIPYNLKVAVKSTTKDREHTNQTVLIVGPK